MKSEFKEKIKIFEGKQVRTVWDEKTGKRWFSIPDIIGILTDQPDYTKARNYWKWFKNKLKDEGSELVRDTNRLKMCTPGGKMRLTDVADTEQILRLIQFIPSPKTESFKMWLARAGYECIAEFSETLDLF